MELMVSNPRSPNIIEMFEMFEMSNPLVQDILTMFGP